MKRAIYLNLVVLLVAAAGADCATITVRADGSGDYPTIQAAIDAAVGGDEVVCADGVYTGDGNRSIDFLGKAITVRSENGPENCIIDYERERNCSGFYFHSGEDSDSVVSGFTIKRGNAFLYSSAGIHCNGGSPTITNCKIVGNMGEGSGIYCREGSATITGCVIMGNRGGYGILCLHDTMVTITDCIISCNRGGIRCDTATITGCIISDNISDYEGGGVHLHSGSIKDCTITGNIAESSGGGICGDYWSGGLVSITNCIISGNQADEGDGAIYSCHGPITNCTITGNRSAWGGGLASCKGPVTNCIIRDNYPGQIYNSLLVSYCNVEGGWEGEGNIDAEALFAMEGDYHLLPGSPCIDAGTNDPCGGLPGGDMDGAIRPVDGDGDGEAVADMGAYEFALDSSTIAVSAKSFYFAQDWPGREPQVLKIRNSGVGTLSWEVVEDCEWLEVSPSSGVSTDDIDEVVITVDANGLEPGLYRCQLYINDVNASNSPLSIPVMMPVGGVREVPSEDYPTIQSAIDAAGNFDVVLLADGIYTGEGNRDLDFLGKEIAVCSENGAENCIIDCEGSEEEPHRGFYFHTRENKNSILHGITVINGFVNGDATGRGYGGAILCFSSPTIHNCTISNNFAGRDGGGIYYAGCECGISIIRNCTIRNNFAGGFGGGISLGGRNYYTYISDCLVEDNQSGHACGGIFLGSHYGSSREKADVDNCVIRGNISETSGGIAWNRVEVTMSKCTISDNRATEVGGGLVCCGRGQSRLDNCTISGNVAGIQGGAAYYWGGYSETDAIVNCTIANNRAREGGGIFAVYESDVSLTNCIMWGNGAIDGNEIYAAVATSSSGKQYFSTVNVGYSDIEGGMDGAYVEGGSTLNWFEGNIDADPCFVMAGYWDVNGTPEDEDDDFWVDGDYHLLAESVCINAGDPNYVAEPGEVDLDGVSRVLFGRIDMGAYEYNLIETEMELTPQMLNCGSSGNRVEAHFVLPEGYLPEDVDVNSPAVAEPVGAVSEAIEVLDEGDGYYRIVAVFDREGFCEALGGEVEKELEVTVTGAFTDGAEFYGMDTIKLISNRWQHRKDSPKASLSSLVTGR